MKRRLRSLAALAAVPALLLSFAGPASAANEAMVRVLHASPDAPAVDVKVNDANVLTNVPFKTISNYLPLAAGTYNIKVCATGTATCVINADLTFAANTKYTVAATNVLASIEAKVITDAPAPAAGTTQVRVIHFSSDTPAVDVLTQDGATTVVDNLAYPNATNYLSLPGGSYDLKVCANADNSVCPLDPAALSLANGTAYSVFAVGSLQGGTLAAVVATDATAASSATPPPTDTELGEQTSTGSGLPVGMLLFLAAATTVAAIVGRMAVARAGVRR
jgi:hypothetical protein